MKHLISRIIFILILFPSLNAVAQIQHGTAKLINANTDTEIRTFTTDITHYLSEADSLNLVIEPVGTITQLRFIASNGRDHTESVAPYAFYRDDAGDYGFNSTGIYFGWAPTVGDLNITLEYINSGTIVNTDSFTITFEQEPPTTSNGASVWTEDNSTQNEPFIYYDEGNVGIGTPDPGTWKLAVNGKIRSKEIKVETGWADYVFTDDHILPTLEEVEKHIMEHGRLINIPSAEEVEANGIELGDMNRLLLEKIEELTLYILEQDKIQDQLVKRIQSIKTKRLSNDVNNTQ